MIFLISVNNVNKHDDVIWESFVDAINDVINSVLDMEVSIFATVSSTITSVLWKVQLFGSEEDIAKFINCLQKLSIAYDSWPIVIDEVTNTKVLRGYSTYMNTRYTSPMPQEDDSFIKVKKIG